MNKNIKKQNLSIAKDLSSLIHKQLCKNKIYQIWFDFSKMCLSMQTYG